MIFTFRLVIAAATTKLKPTVLIVDGDENMWEQNAQLDPATPNLKPTVLIEEPREAGT